MGVQEQLVAQIDDGLVEFEALLKRSKYDDISDLPELEVTRFVSRARAAIDRVAGHRSPYVDQSDRVFEEGGYSGYLARALAGILHSLRADVAAGYLLSQHELLYAELLDFLEMAQHLANEGDKMMPTTAPYCATEDSLGVAVGRTLTERCQSVAPTTPVDDLRPNRCMLH